MTRHSLVLALCLLAACQSDPSLGALERETAALRAELARQESALLRLTEASQELQRQLDDARVLALLGGPKRRYAGGVSCDGGAYLPGSFGAAGHRALMKTGLCLPAEPLPVPDLKLASDR
jgi:hypothetical protein